jgi:5-methylcytosine-specific restriction endonuclease McrA
MKKCSACGVSKPETSFHWKFRDKGVRVSTCKECANARAKKWRADNLDRKRALNRAYHEANRDEARAYRKQYRAANLERVREADRRYWAENNEACLARAKVWREANRQRRTALENRRRAHFADIQPADWEYMEILRGDPCSYCDADADSVDHIEPLSGGGAVGWTNLTGSCRDCNSRKKTLPMMIFLHRTAQSALK